MMGKGMKKRAATGLVLMLSLAVVFTGCGNDAGNGANGANSANGKVSGATELSGRYIVDGNTPAWKLDKKEKTRLKWYVNADWWNKDWGNDTVTRKIKSDLKLDVEFVTGDDTKLNTFYASNELPDIVTIFNSSSSVAKSATRWALSLNDLADKFDPYFYKVAKKSTLDWYKMDDGKTYGYPDYSNSQQDYDDGLIKTATAFVMRKDVYEALGKPDMGTPEKFIEVLSEIKQKYPKMVPFGFNDMTKSTGSLCADFQNFIGVPVENKDGTWYDRNLDNDYLSWIKTYNKAYTMGLISDDRFADDNTAFEEKIKTGQYATIMIGGTPQRSGALQVWVSAQPDAAYIAIDGPKSTVGNAPALSQSGVSGWGINYISKRCSDPVKAIELFTYLLSDDAGVLTTYGVEGETYKVNADGKYELLPEVKKMKASDNDKFKKQYRLGEFCLFGHDRYLSLGAEQAESIAQMQEWGKGKLKSQFVIENIEPDQGSAEARGVTAINNNWNTALVSLIRAKDAAAFDKLISDYKKFREDNNWNDIVKIRNEKMAENREKLGIK